MSFLKIFSAAAILDFLGLQTKASAQRRVFTNAALIAGGVVVGAGAALFLAPKSGRELRSDVKHRAQELSARMNESRAVQNAKRRIGEMKSRVEERVESIEDPSIPQHV